MAIAAYCERSGQVVPSDDAAIVRCALESLALRYRDVLCSLEELTNTRIETIHIVGGGTQNKQLCQMTADACNRRVEAGPVEATAIGNAMMQAIALGHVQSIPAAREIVRRSSVVEAYEPREAAPWDDAFERFKRLCPE
jgi:sugar (pentulose or hexulose) kinase